VPAVHDLTEEDEPRTNWVVRSLYVGLIAANLYLLFDWWAQTDQGRATVERWAAKIEAAKVKAQECEGCAQRKAWLRKQANRMHWQAEQIVAGEDVETQPEQPAP
jgi:hypothetical protein